jgi:hypothetical protein
MKYRERLRAQLKNEEGVRQELYKCPAGKNTIGRGHNCDAIPLPDKIQSFLDERGYITDEMIVALLDLDIDRAEADAGRLFPGFDAYSANRRVALVDLFLTSGLPDSPSSSGPSMPSSAMIGKQPPSNCGCRNGTRKSAQEGPAWLN